MLRARRAARRAGALRPRAVLAVRAARRRRTTPTATASGRRVGTPSAAAPAAVVIAAGCVAARRPGAGAARHRDRAVADRTVPRQARVGRRPADARRGTSRPERRSPVDRHRTGRRRRRRARPPSRPSTASPAVAPAAGGAATASPSSTSVLDAEPGTDARPSTPVRRAARRRARRRPGRAGARRRRRRATDARRKRAATRDQLVVIPLILARGAASCCVLLLRAGRRAAAAGAHRGRDVLRQPRRGWLRLRAVLGFPALDPACRCSRFLFLVALGVDYNIFLVTRAREEAPRATAPATGMLRALAVTGGVITSAGILLAAVFAVLGVLPLITLDPDRRHRRLRRAARHPARAHRAGAGARAPARRPVLVARRALASRWPAVDRPGPQPGQSMRYGLGPGAQVTSCSAA